MQKLEVKDLKKGEIYYTIYSHKRNPVIFNLKRDDSYDMVNYIYNCEKWYSNASLAHDENAKNNIVLASPSQIQWFNACKEANCFIPLHKVINKIYELWI